MVKSLCGKNSQSFSISWYLLTFPEGKNIMFLIVTRSCIERLFYCPRLFDFCARRPLCLVGIAGPLPLPFHFWLGGPLGVSIFRSFYPLCSIFARSSSIPSSHYREATAAPSSSSSARPAAATASAGGAARGPPRGRQSRCSGWTKFCSTATFRTLSGQRPSWPFRAYLGL